MTNDWFLSHPDVPFKAVVKTVVCHAWRDHPCLKEYLFLSSSRWNLSSGDGNVEDVL